MDFDSDRLLLARAQLSDLLDTLRLTSFDANPVQFLMRLDTIRHTAIQHRFDAVAEIAAHFEDAMQRILHANSGHIIVRNYVEILEEAIGCIQMDFGAAQSMLASVAMRLRV